MIQVQPCDWGPSAAVLIDQAKGHSTLEEMRLEVESKRADLFGVFHQGQMIGAFMLRIDAYETGSEGVIMAAAGSLKGHDLMELIVPDIEQRFSGCDVIRTHTAIPALARKWRRFGYVPREIVMAKKVGNVV